MQINGKVHCLFEQSGTFKNEFKKLGYEAYDYDIQNHFGETDYVIDLFSEIDNAYNGEHSIFDTMTGDDLIVAFYPCIYFCEASQSAFKYTYINYRSYDNVGKIKLILQREKNRHEFYERLLKFVGICEARKLRMIFENPYTQPHYLANNFVINPTVIDKDRSRRGDIMRKPTQYFFFNCKPTHGFTHQQTPSDKIKKVDDFKHGIETGLCNEERSMISPDYARNWICDFVIGKHQDIGEPTFDFGDIA